MGIRKIVHLDMDAFYASVEQRDNPELRGKPVIIAWKGNRSGVPTASYEARKFGVRSAMPAARADRLCPEAIFTPPDFTRYRAVSRLTREIFKRHTDLVEPLSLDEAYLDVTENKTGLPTATRVASTIREQIRQELNLTASAGVAPNKFLAKLTSGSRCANTALTFCALVIFPAFTNRARSFKRATAPKCSISWQSDPEPRSNVHVHGSNSSITISSASEVVW